MNTMYFCAMDNIKLMVNTKVYSNSTWATKAKLPVVIQSLLSYYRFFLSPVPDTNMDPVFFPLISDLP